MFIYVSSAGRAPICFVRLMVLVWELHIGVKKRAKKTLVYAYPAYLHYGIRVVIALTVSIPLPALLKRSL